jgi:hypothetical protein
MSSATATIQQALPSPSTPPPTTKKETLSTPKASNATPLKLKKVAEPQRQPGNNNGSSNTVATTNSSTTDLAANDSNNNKITPPARSNNIKTPATASSTPTKSMTTAAVGASTVQRITSSKHEEFKNQLVHDVFGRDNKGRVPMEKVAMLIWQFRTDPAVVQFMAQFVAKVCPRPSIFLDVLSIQLMFGTRSLWWWCVCSIGRA